MNIFLSAALTLLLVQAVLFGIMAIVGRRLSYGVHQGMGLLVIALWPVIVTLCVLGQVAA